MNGTKKIYAHEGCQYYGQEGQSGDRMLHNRELYQQLLHLRGDNTLHLATLHRYESSLVRR